MAQVLEDWVLEIVGSNEPLSIDAGESLYDGVMFHDILCKYNIINVSKCPRPPKQPSSKVARRSMFELGAWFKLLGITHSKELLEAAANKDSKACMRILFELFAKLHTQDNTYFVSAQKAASIEENTRSRFIVRKAAEPPEPLYQLPYYFRLEDLLRDQRNILESYKETKKAMSKWTKGEVIRRREVVKKWAETKTILSTEFEEKAKYIKPPENPIDVFNKSLNARRTKEEHLNVPYEDYVTYLKQKRRKTLASYALKKKMQDTIIHDLWMEIINERDREFTDSFKTILLQPCEYEDQLSTTLQNLHDNYKNFNKFTRHVNSLSDEQYSLAESMYQSEKKWKKEYLTRKEMERVLELHKRLWEEKLRVKREKHIQYCQQVVYDIVSHALKTAEFKNEFKTEPAKQIVDEWKELFFKELPVLREPRSFIERIKEDRELPVSLKGTAMEVTPREVVTTEENEIDTNLGRKISGQQEVNLVPHISEQNFGFADFLPTNFGQTLDRQTDEKGETVEWDVFMDFPKSNDVIPSYLRMPYMADLKTPVNSNIINVTEQENKCEDDLECLLDRDVVDCLNNYDLRRYLNTFGPWDLQQWPQLWPTVPFDEKLNVLGYVIHRLLDLKYPFFKGPKRPRLPNFKIKAILGKMSDPNVSYILESLRDLLNKENVELIDPSVPVNYCLNVYKEELGITELGGVLKQLKGLKYSNVELEVEERQSPYKRWNKRPPKYPEKPPKRIEILPPLMQKPKEKDDTSPKSRKKSGSRKSLSRKSVSRKSVARKSVARKSVARKSVARKSVARKSQASRKSMRRKSSKRMSLSKKKSKPSKGKSKTSEALKHLGRGGINKATQKPSLPDLRTVYKHSPAGKLGKLAFETLAEGKKLNNALLGNMLIEYLKTLEDKKGFVLVNFPNSAAQANVFEHQFSGLPIQYPLKFDSEVDLFRTNSQIDFFSHLRSFLDFERMLGNYVKEIEPPPEPEEEPEVEAVDEGKIKKDKEKTKKKSGGRKSVSRKSVSRKSLKRKSTARKSKTPRQSKTPRKSKTARKSVARKSIKRKSVSGSKSPPKSVEKKADVKEEIVPPSLPTPEEPPKPPLTLEELCKFRISEILPRPNKDLDDLQFGADSYFTKYVNPVQVQAQKEDEKELLRVKKEAFDKNPALLLIKEENKPYPFYNNLRLVHNFDYMYLDLETIKRLARVILGEIWDTDDMTRKPSIELFGVPNLEKVGKGPPKSSSSGSSEGSRLSFYESQAPPKRLHLEAGQETSYRKYLPIKPPQIMPVQVLPEDAEIEKDSESNVGKSSKAKQQRGSRKSIKRKSVARKSMSRKSMKRKSSARKSMKRKSTARKSMKRKSTARKSMKRKSTARKSMKKKSVAGKSAGRKSIKSAYSRKEKSSPESFEGPPKPKPGDPDWTYINEPIPYEISYTTATFWECAEFVYLENLEKIFYLLRMHGEKVLPYREYIRTSLNEAMREENEKRHLVTNFQLMLNKVDDDFRHDADMKHELFVRAKELYDIMIGVATNRREKSLVKKAELIAQGWVANHVYVLANLYLSMAQVEMDLYVDSLQVLYDYYTAILEKIPKPERQRKSILGKNKMTTENVVLSKTSTSRGRRRRRSASKTSLPQITFRPSLVIPSKIEQFLLQGNVTEPSSRGSPDSAEPEPNPTYPLISNQIESLKPKISGLRSAYKTIIDDPELGKELRGRKMGERAAGGQLAVQSAPGTTPKSDRSKRKSSIRRQSKRKSTARRQSKRKSTARRQSKRKSTARRQSKRKSSVRRQSKKSIRRKSKGTSGTKGSKRSRSKSPRAAQDELPDMVDVLKEEWSAAVEFLGHRTNFRLKLIEARAKKDLDLVMDLMKETFIDYQKQLNDQLMNEVTAIDNCMYVFKRAIEEGSPIQPMMVLDDSRFFVDRKILLFPDPPPPPPVPLEESRDPYSFTVEQLNTLVKKFSQMAPMGVVETPLIQILNDMAIAGHEEGKPVLPSAWVKLDAYNYKDIITEAFADQTCLDWRNFMINIADLPYPTIEELMNLKNQYRAKDVGHDEIITFKDFESVPLWFENEFGETIEDDLKLSLAKTLIFRMFKINDDEMNYYDMLMGYCRAEDPEDGLGMALDLLLDTGYILQPEKCLRADEFDNINPRKIIDFILVHFIDDILNLTENVQLKFLPPLTNQEVYASDENQFEISEDILRNNMGKRREYGDLSSTDSETNRPKPERQLFLDDDDELPPKYDCDKWQMCVPYEIALALILNALNYYALSPIHQHRYLNVEQRLKDLYNERGTGTHIKAYRLTTSDLFKDLFEKTNIFKKTNIIKMVQQIVETKQEAKASGKPMSELARD